jgi:hypothetical protein
MNNPPTATDADPDGRWIGFVLASIDKAYTAIGAGHEPDDRDPAYIGELVTGHIAGLQSALTDSRRQTEEAQRAAEEARGEAQEYKDAAEGIAYLKRVECDGGRMTVDLTVARELVCRMTDAMRVMLGDAKNYVECDLANDAGERFTFTIQKPNGKTPHECRKEAEKQRDTALADLAQARGEWVACSDRKPELNKRVTVNASGYVCDGYWMNNKCGIERWETANGTPFISDITHWRPLPHPPETSTASGV